MRFLHRRRVYGVVTESNKHVDKVVGSNLGCGILAIPINGLCIGGGDMNSECTSVGYIVLSRKGQDMETENFKYYHENIFRPYIHQKRSKEKDDPILRKKE